MGKALEQIKERILLAWSQFLESSLYNSFREQFDALSRRTQQLVVAGFSLVVTLILIMIPYSYWSTSSDHMTNFETNRSLIRELLKAVRFKQENPSFPPQVPSQVLQTRVDDALKEMNLNADQIGSIAAMSGRSPLVPAGVKMDGLDVELKKLNILQVIDIGHRLQTLDPSLKMIGLNVQRSPAQSHYYDVSFKIISMGVGS